MDGQYSCYGIVYQKKVADLLVLQLSIVEFTGVAWNVILRPIQWFAPKKHVSMVRLIGNMIFSTLFYHQHTKYLQFDWLMNTTHITYLGSYFFHNLIGYQLEISRK